MGAPYDGRRFDNEEPTPDHGLRGFLRWQLHRRATPWPPYDAPQIAAAPPASVGGTALQATWVGHSTVLLQLDGCNVLTDPIWSERASPLRWAGPRRHHPPALRFADLPPIHLVLVSHGHYEHLDRPTLARLRRDHGCPVVLPRGLGRLLGRGPGPPVLEMDWGERLRAPGCEALELSCLPARHMSHRGPLDQGRTLWAAFALRGSRHAVYFAGDTGYGRHFGAAARAAGPFDLALLPIGAFRPRWFMRPVHMGPHDALRALDDLGAGAAMAIHFGTFRLADDGRDEAPELLRRLLARPERAGTRFCVPRFGETLALDATI